MLAGLVGLVSLFAGLLVGVSQLTPCVHSDLSMSVSVGWFSLFSLFVGVGVSADTLSLQ